METDMALTYYDLLEKIAQLDELTIIEILDIDSQDLVAKFSDRINDRLDELAKEF
tara:strand:- start:221 stop:385 length:165 start_codon:yes stop_codon:yes gene_type:complete